MKRLTALLLIVGSVHAYAYRREYRVMLNGKRKEGSEVCFYRGETARNPFGLFFTYDKVRCLPADEVLDFPPGLFHVFARHRDGFVSEHRDYFAYRGEPNPERGYAALEIPLRESATVDVGPILRQLKRGESVGIWIAQTPTTAGTFFPLVDGETSIVVPPDTPLLPLLIANHEPAAIGEPLYLSPREKHTLQGFQPQGTGAGAVVAWVRADRDLLQKSPGLSPPEVALNVGGKLFKPLFPLYDDDVAVTPLFFTHVPAGQTQLVTMSHFWRAAAETIPVIADSTIVQREPLQVVPTGGVVVSWAGIDGPTEESEACRAAPKELYSEMRAAIELCDSSDKCDRVATRSAKHGDISIVFDGVSAGNYRVILKPPGAAKPLARQAVVEVGRDATLTMPIEAFRFFGTVKLNGKPLPSRLFFSTGTAATDRTGSYTAMLSADPSTNLLTITTCDDGRVLRYIPAGHIAQNSRFDIDLQIETLNVTVRADGRPAQDATVWYAPMKETNDGSVFYTSPQKTSNAEGLVMFEDVPTNKPISICASKQGFDVTCIDTTTPAPATADVNLRRAAQSGRIVNHEGTAYIAAVDPTGRMSEYVSVASDGAFSFQQLHKSPEYLVYTSNRHPLVVLPIGADAEAGTLTLTLPQAPVRSFAVSVPSMKGKEGIVGVWVGNAYVPLQILVLHEEARGHDGLIHRGERLILNDIAETAPISVAFAEYPDEEPIDVFTRPQYAGAARVPVTQADITIRNR